MKNINRNNIEQLFTFHDIYPNIPQYDIIGEIKKIDLEVGISVICELIRSLNYKIDIGLTSFCLPYETWLKKEFCGINPHSVDQFMECEELRKDKHIISQQILLLLLKNFFIYGKCLPTKANKVTAEVYQRIINLCLMITEKCNYFIESPSFDANNFIYCNYHVNRSKNIAAAFVRTYYMLEVLNPQKDLFLDVEREYKNYNQAYFDKYGFGILETLSILFWEMRAYIGTEKERLSYTPIWKTVDEVYGETPLNRTADEVIKLLSMKPSQYKEWAEKSAERIWDFTSFLSKPFIIDENKRYVSISEYTLENAFFENIFWLIRDCYPLNDKSSMAFYGRLFEKYIQKLSEAATLNIKIYLI